MSSTQSVVQLISCFFLTCALKLFFLWGSNNLNMIIVGDPACAAIPFVLETAIHRQIFNVIRRLYMSHATMLEMANQEHAQFGRPVAATNKSSTDVTSLWMRLPSVLYLQQPELKYSYCFDLIPPASS